MGRELITTIRCGKQTAKAKILLETREIISRGEIKRKFPFASMKKLAARSGWLEFDCDGERVAIQLDEAAEAWLQRIKNPPSHIEKLRVKPGMKVLLAGNVEAGISDELEKAGAKVISQPADDLDAVLLFVRTLRELKELARLKTRLGENGMAWVFWPKGSGGAVKHEDVAAAGKSAGLSQTISMGFSEVFTGLRFVRSKK